MIFVLLPLGGCPPMNGPSNAGPFLVHVGDDLVHQASGTVFPARVTGFQRVNGHVFSRDGRDIGVEYNLLGANGAMPTIVATVYVYPAPSLV